MTTAVATMKAAQVAAAELVLKSSNWRFPIQAPDRCASRLRHVVCATVMRSSPKASGQESPIRGFPVMKWPA